MYKYISRVQIALLWGKNVDDPCSDLIDSHKATRMLD